MKDLIEALQIFIKYKDDYAPINCSYDQMYVNVSPEIVSEADVIRLDELGFFVDEQSEGFSSYRFGSC